MFAETLIISVLAWSGTVATGPGPAGGYEVVPVEDGGSISGVVKFDGDVPSVETLETPTTDEVCHTEPIPDEALVVSGDKGLQWAVVSLRDIKSGKPFPEEGQVLDQAGCRFFPHVVVTPAGDELRVLNSDGVLHNVHTKSLKNSPINRSMRADVKELELKFKRSETVSVTCDVHSWMKAWIVVASNPYYAVTDADGAFRMDDVPPGTYKVRVWHETLGKQDGEVVVSANGATTVDFEMKAK